ncbi:ENKD1 [Scenedesmus sp. PABB004]|nr:ENKD1 [Scenedesmus sp. PABB004]
MGALRRHRAAPGRGAMSRLCLALLLAAAAVDGRSIGATSKPKAKRATGACVADSYAALAALSASASALAACVPAGGGDAAITLACDAGAAPGEATVFARRAGDPAWVVGAASGGPAGVAVSSACGHVLLFDLNANPALPALAVRGADAAGGLRRFNLTGVRLRVLRRAGDALPDCAGAARPCPAPSVLRATGLESLSLSRVNVTSPGSSAGLAQGLEPDQLPYTGIRVDGVRGVSLTNVSVVWCVDGVAITGGGAVTATHLRASRNSAAGLYYACGAGSGGGGGGGAGPNSLAVLGQSGMVDNGAAGLWVDCEGSAAGVDLAVRDHAGLGRNRQGAVLLGHVHASIGPGASFWQNGNGSDPAANMTECGAGEYGAALCLQIPIDGESAVPAVTAPIQLLDKVLIHANWARGCGAALATVANLHKAALKVNVTAGARVTEANAAGAAPGCGRGQRTCDCRLVDQATSRQAEGPGWLALCWEMKALLALLLLAAAAAPGSGGSGPAQAPPSPSPRPYVPGDVEEEDPPCTLASYAELVVAANDDVACGDDYKGMLLSCNASAVWERGAAPALSIEHDEYEPDIDSPWIKLLGAADASCAPGSRHTLVFDLAQNPEVPLITVRGDIGVDKFTMANLRLVVKGAPPGPPPACAARPCPVRALIEVRNLMQLELDNVSIEFVPSPGGPARLPYAGISITNIAYGTPVISLNNVSVSGCVDGLVVFGGGMTTLDGVRLADNAELGMYYSCSMVQASSLTIRDGSLLTDNGMAGLLAECEGDLSPPLNVTLFDRVAVTDNQGPGVQLLGNIDAVLGPHVSISDNGWGGPPRLGGGAAAPPPPDCGGGVHLRSRFGSPSLALTETVVRNNTARLGGGLCAEVPAEAQPLFSKVAGRVDLLQGTVLTGNVATECGGALATLADLAKARFRVDLGVGARLLADNAAPKAPGWCLMFEADGDEEPIDVTVLTQHQHAPRRPRREQSASFGEACTQQAAARAMRSWKGVQGRCLDPWPRAAALLALLLLAAAAAPGTAGSGAAQAPPRAAAAAVAASPAPNVTDIELGHGGCTVHDYAGLAQTANDDAGCGDDYRTITLSCVPGPNGGTGTYVRRAGDDVLHVAHNEYEPEIQSPSVTIAGDAASCAAYGGVATIEVDLSANPAMPVLTVRGDIGVEKLVLSNLRIVLRGAPADADPGCVAAGLHARCPATPIIDVRNVQHVEMDNVTIEYEGNGTLPYSGIVISTIAYGAPWVRLGNVRVSGCVDGLAVAGGGDTSLSGVAFDGNSHAGMYYSCSMVNPSSLNVSAASLSGNGLLGLLAECEGDLSPPMNITLSDGVRVEDNGGGLELLGNVHVNMGPGTRIAGNGWRAPPACGGAVHARLRFGSPSLLLNATHVLNNTALSGGGLCMEVPADSTPMLSKVSGRLFLLGRTLLAGNVARDCGGALTTLADLAKARMRVEVGLGTVAVGNVAPKAPAWCLMFEADGDEEPVEAARPSYLNGVTDPRPPQHRLHAPGHAAARRSSSGARASRPRAPPPAPRAPAAGPARSQTRTARRAPAMARRREKEESVYDWGRAAPGGRCSGAGGAGPRTKTYNVAAPAAGGKPKMHVDSSQVEAILNPVRGIRDAQARAGITPTNHARHNVTVIKEQSRLNALHKAAAAEEAAAAAAAAFRPQLRRTSSGGGGGGGGLARSSSGGGGGGGGGSLARSSSGGRNFVEENKAAAAAAARPVKAEARGEPGAAFLSKSEYGQVPAYLLERKMQMVQEQDALLAAKQAAQIPPGLRRMPDDERREALRLLEANRGEVEARLAALPIIIETPSQVRHKDDLERRLREIEDAAKIFARPNVLVAAAAAPPGGAAAGLPPRAQQRGAR